MGEYSISASVWTRASKVQIDEFVSWSIQICYAKLSVYWFTFNWIIYT